MPTSTVLVTGATGRVGRLVTANLIERGIRVRAMTRRPADADLPGAEVVSGDLTSAPDDTVLAGVEAVLVSPAYGDLRPFLAAAARAGVHHAVVLSSLAAALEHERDHGSVSALHHLGVESAVAGSGIPATVLRPGTFAANLLTWAFPIRATGRVEGPYPASRQAPVHEADVSDALVACLTDPGLRGAVHPLTGPESLTRVQQLDAIGAAIGRSLTFLPATPEQFRAAMQGRMDDAVVTMLLDYWRDTVEKPDVVRDLMRLTGRPGRTLREWAEEHRADFAG